MSEAIERAIEEAERLFVSAGQAKVNAEAMDLRRKRVRATLFVKYKGDGNAAGASEQMAEADPVYELACTDWQNAALEAEPCARRRRPNGCVSMRGAPPTRPNAPR